MALLPLLFLYYKLIPISLPKMKQGHLLRSLFSVYERELCISARVQSLGAGDLVALKLLLGILTPRRFHVL